MDATTTSYNDKVFTLLEEGYEQLKANPNIAQTVLLLGDAVDTSYGITPEPYSDERVEALINRRTT